MERFPADHPDDPRTLADRIADALYAQANTAAALGGASRFAFREAVNAASDCAGTDDPDARRAWIVASQTLETAARAMSAAARALSHARDITPAAGVIEAKGGAQ